jgi:hypothetical protein
MINLSDEGSLALLLTLIKNKQKAPAEVKSVTPVNTIMIRKQDNSLVTHMDRLLMVWLDDQTSHHVLLNQAIIQNKAKNLINYMKAKKGEAVKDAEFGASHGWFDRFKKRSNLYNIKVQEEAAAAESFPWDLVDITDDGGYTKDEILNVDEMGVF